MSAPDADVIVLGAGPAGIAAALAAAAHGLGTLLLDESPAPGGQLHRALPAGWRAKDPAALGPDFAAGEAMRAALATSPACFLGGRSVWNLARDAGGGFTLETAPVDGGDGRQLHATALILATGATERILPCPGWTLPGVIGLAGATILLKSQRAVPGTSVLVAGVGPLLYAVAADIVKAGGKVAAVVDAASPGEWLRCLPALLAQPALLRRGLGWIRKLRGAGVPLLFRHSLLELRGTTQVQEAVVARLGADGAPDAGAISRFAVDGVAIGHGLLPATEAARLLGAAMRYEAEPGFWRPERDQDGRSSIPMLFVAGDGAGIGGGLAARHAGEIAGLAAARDLDRLDAAAHAAAVAGPRRAWQQAARTGQAMARMMRPRPAIAAAIPPETIICRCEDVPRATLDRSIAQGAVTLNQLKSWTRCGMGPCQGRFCAAAAGALLAAKHGDAEAVGLITARMPLRPVPVATLVAGFDYARDVPPPVLVPR